MRSNDADEFVVVINFSNRPVTGQVELENDGHFKPMPIAGLPGSSAGELPQFHLNGFEWRIYQRVLPK